MIVRVLLVILFLASGWSVRVYSQSDSGLNQLKKIPDRFVQSVNKKVIKYESRISKKMEKTLTRLSKWESKIKSLIDRVDPKASEKLFSRNQMTFASLLKQLKTADLNNDNSFAGYSRYLDKLSSGIKFVEAEGKIFDSTAESSREKSIGEINELRKTLANEQLVEQFIRERKNLLIEQGLKVLGKSKLLIKMNKEAYYYVQSMRNYKELFNKANKVEELAFDVLKKVAGFESFSKSQSPLSGVFGTGFGLSSVGNGNSSEVVSGLVSRPQLQNYINQHIPSLSQTDISSKLSKMIPDMKPQLDKLKKRFTEIGGMGNEQMPAFKPNTQKSKLFWQRIEYGFDLQFGKSVNLLPSTSDIAAKVGYKINDKSIIGIGINYKLGLGSGWNKIRLSNEGIGLRTYIKWKVAKAFDLQGGGEWNYFSTFKKLEALRNWEKWQKSALLGVSKQYKVTKKMKGNFQAMYDFLHAEHKPVSAPFVFRLGYDF